MCPHKLSGIPPRGRYRPGVEGLEARDLPSGATPLFGPAMLVQEPVADSIRSPSHAMEASRRLLSGSRPVHALAGGGHAGRLQLPNPNLIPGFINTLYGPSSATPMTPTPREVIRQIFTARFVASYTVGPPRFNDRASTIHGITSGDDAVSNQFLKAKAQFVLFPPADPNATPNYGNPYANQVTGEATFFTENFLQSGNLLILDLNGSADTEVNALPTHLTWNYDGASGGAYTAPVGFTQGTGTVDLKYLPDRHPKLGTMGSGQVIVTFQGLINQSQIVNAVAKIYS
ncbi:MAG: hypothetical protein JO034_12725 [Singulisphaera sp.]|nr:hypothetical protein [Singulisphaera sp.]